MLFHPKTHNPNVLQIAGHGGRTIPPQRPIQNHLECQNSGEHRRKFYILYLNAALFRLVIKLAPTLRSLLFALQILTQSAIKQNTTIRDSSMVRRVYFVLFLCLSHRIHWLHLNRTDRMSPPLLFALGKFHHHGAHAQHRLTRIAQGRRNID